MPLNERTGYMQPPEYICIYDSDYLCPVRLSDKSDFKCLVKDTGCPFWHKYPKNKFPKGT